MPNDTVTQSGDLALQSKHLYTKSTLAIVIRYLITRQLHQFPEFLVFKIVLDVWVLSNHLYRVVFLLYLLFLG